MYTTTMELGPKRPSLLWFWDLNSIIGVFLDPLGKQPLTAITELLSTVILPRMVSGVQGVAHWGLRAKLFEA